MEEETQQISRTEPQKNSQYSAGFQKLMQSALKNISRPKNSTTMSGGPYYRTQKNKSSGKFKSSIQKHKTMERQSFEDTSFVKPLFPSIGRTTTHSKKQQMLKKGAPHYLSIQRNEYPHERRGFSFNSYFTQCMEWTTEEKEKILFEMNKNKYKFNRMGNTKTYFHNIHAPSTHINSDIVLQRLNSHRHDSEKGYSFFEEDHCLNEYTSEGLNQDGIIENMRKNGGRRTQKDKKWILDPWQTEESTLKFEDRINSAIESPGLHVSIIKQQELVGRL